MPAEMTLEVFETLLSKFKKQDMQKKIDIASNVGKQCETKLKSIIKYKDMPSLSKCYELTGVPTEILLAVQSLDNKSIKFEEWLTERKQLIKRYSYEYTNIRKLLIKHYTQLLEVPTGLKDHNEYDGYKKFFTLVQLPGTKASIIVEKPETVMDRHRYLYTKLMYIEQDKHIVYIGKINLMLTNGKFSYKEDTAEAKNQYFVAASQRLGHMGHLYMYCRNNNEDYMSYWVEDKIIPQLPEESVIIFEENLFNNDDPIVNDLSKEDIINWLNLNQVPHDPTIHRAELYKLVKTEQRRWVQQLSQAELVFRARGHITIRKKRCNLNDNYFDPFWAVLIHEFNTASVITLKLKTTMKNQTHAINDQANSIVQNIPLEYWNNLGNKLLEKERNIYKEDLEMEHIIDKLMTMVKNEGMPKEWETKEKLDEYNKTADQEYIILSENIMKLYEKMQKPKFHKSDLNR